MKPDTVSSGGIKAGPSTARTPRQRPIGKYFLVSLGTLEKLFEHFADDQWIEPIIAYLILCKHQYKAKDMTTAGAPAIANFLKISRYHAEHILGELEGVRWGKTDKDRAVLPTDEAVGRFPVKQLPRQGKLMIRLPYQLFLGTNGRSSLLKLLLEPDRQLRFDVLNILLHCYAYYDIEHSGDYWTLRKRFGRNGEVRGRQRSIIFPWAIKANMGIIFSWSVLHIR